MRFLFCLKSLRSASCLHLEYTVKSPVCGDNMEGGRLLNVKTTRRKSCAPRYNKSYSMQSLRRYWGAFMTFMKHLGKERAHSVFFCIYFECQVMSSQSALLTGYVYRWRFSVKETQQSNIDIVLCLERLLIALLKQCKIVLFCFVLKEMFM